jgi:hypothetical protein
MMPKITDRRVERRYPLSDIYSKYVSCKLFISGSDCLEAQLLEFSMNGLKLQSPVHKEMDSELDCIISLPKLYPKDLRTRIKIRHVEPAPDEDGDFILGAMIIEADKSYLTRVFTKIIEFVTTRNGDLF